MPVKLCSSNKGNFKTKSEFKNLCRNKKESKIDMENRQLSRRVDNAKRDFESIIDELISEIEQLEITKDEMQDEIDLLKNKISDLENN